MPSNQPIVLLREVTGERYLPIWIGAVEATAIAFAQQGVVPPRPLTHDLLKDVARGHRQRARRGADHRGQGRRLLRHAGLRLGRRGERPPVGLDRPGAAHRLPDRCAEEVLDEAGLAVPDEQEDEVEKFREFLDQVTPEDFEEPRLAEPRGRGAPEPSPSS